ncbi:MAG: 2-oxo acid dehydrogenase subunit E2 [Sedimentibacter sp.]
MNENNSYEIKIKDKKRQNVARRYMSKFMLNNWNTIPHMIQMSEARADNIINVKKEIGNVSFNDIILKAVANSVKDVPLINSTLDGEDLITYEDINIAVAVVSDSGLYVPVVRNADKKSVHEISNEVKEFANKAAKNAIMPDDMAFGTITVSNLGSTAVYTGTPVINAPQGAMIFIGTIRKEPVVNENNEIVVGNVLGFSIAYDHRFIDGMLGQQFTTRLKQEIETISVEKYDN